MGFKLGDAVSIARGILQDRDVGFFRFSDADLLQYANDALDQMVGMRPELFHAEGRITCVAGTIQSVSFADARSLVLVRRIKDGPAVVPVVRAVLDLFDPSWYEDPPGPAVNWMAVEGDPVRFLVYPPSPFGQTLEVLYIRNPKEYTATEDTGLPSVFLDAVSDYIVYRAESRDDEHVNAQRAAQSFATFQAKVMGVPRGSQVE
jgi:hypothetical protein